MFRTTHHKIMQVPHQVALVAGIIALASWSWNHQGMHQGAQGMNLQEELAGQSLSEGGQVLFDIGALLLLRGNRS